MRIYQEDIKEGKNEENYQESLDPEVAMKKLRR